MQAEAMAGAVEKVRSGGSADVAVTERGTFFGYGDLVVDMRNFDAAPRAPPAPPVVFDATHSVQQPGQGAGGASGGQREHIPRAARGGGGGGRRRILSRDPSRSGPRARAMPRRSGRSTGSTTSWGGRSTSGPGAHD